MRVLITGAFGWTATAIIETLAQAGYKITAFDLPSVACPQKVKQMSSRVVIGDVADYEAVNEPLVLPNTCSIVNSQPS